MFISLINYARTQSPLPSGCFMLGCSFLPELVPKSSLFKLVLRVAKAAAICPCWS